VVAGLDPRWDKFIDKCLETDPQNRYQNGEAALEAFRQLLQPVASKRWVLPAAIGVALVAAIGVLLWQRSAAPVPAPVSTVKPAASTVVALAPEGGKTEAAATGLQAPPPAPAARKFVIAGLPAGAVVTFRERNHPAGPAGKARLELPPGPQTVHIKAPGYLDWEGDVGAGENELQASVTMELVPPHPVKFTGLPAQAQLKAGDQSAAADASGTATLQLRPGHLAVEATAPKYEALALQLDVLQTTESVPVEMKKLPPPAEVLVKLSDSVTLKFKFVPAGSAYVGSLPDDRGHQRSDLERSKIDLSKGLYFAETEMTQRQHRALTGKNPSDSRALGDDTRPVEQIAWRDIVGAGGVLDKANELLHRLALPYKVDLPTEVEWEYACRAGTDTSFNDGSNVTNERDDPALDKLAYYARGGGSSHDSPSPVAKLKPNAWGIFDMLGNVSEWTYGIRGPREPVLRGGNWSVGVVHCRSASRVEVTAETRPTSTMGYRLVLRMLEE
jgi:formylglycine-generating enzyme required for sulfatase activity